MTPCDAGSVVLVRFPFTDLSSTKKRPALVVSPLSFSQRFGDVVVMPLTSQGQQEADLALSKWQAAGLPKQTWIKPLIGTLSLGIVDRQIGKLDPSDYRCVRAAVALLLAKNCV
jgi:mRNA interferase MazF